MRLHFGCCVTVCIVLSGCSSNLTRSGVRDVIGDTTLNIEDGTGLISYGHVSEYTSGHPCTAQEIPYEVGEARKRRLEEAKIVTVKQLESCTWDIEFTQTASKDVRKAPPDRNSSSGAFADVVLVKYRDYDVTGIAQEGEKANVDISWNYDLTPSGQAYIDGLGEFELPDELRKCNYLRNKQMLSCSRSYLFVRYDDGWRTSIN